jgi:hypothetical protein
MEHDDASDGDVHTFLRSISVSPEPSSHQSKQMHTFQQNITIAPATPSASTSSLQLDNVGNHLMVSAEKTPGFNRSFSADSSLYDSKSFGSPSRTRMRLRFSDFNLPKLARRIKSPPSSPGREARNGSVLNRGVLSSRLSVSQNHNDDQRQQQQPIGERDRIICFVNPFCYLNYLLNVED